MSHSRVQWTQPQTGAIRLGCTLMRQSESTKREQDQRRKNHDNIVNDKVQRTE